MPLSLLTRRALTRELERKTAVAVCQEEVLQCSTSPCRHGVGTQGEAVAAEEIAAVRQADLAALSTLLGLPVLSVRHQPPELAYTVGTPQPTRARLLDEQGREFHLAWFLGIRGLGVVVLASSTSITDMSRLDAWRAAVTGWPADDFPLLRATDRRRALQLLHQLHTLGEAAA